MNSTCRHGKGFDRRKFDECSNIDNASPNPKLVVYKLDDSEADYTRFKASDYRRVTNEICGACGNNRKNFKQIFQ